MKRILIVVDMQNDFVDGALGSVQAEKIVPRVAELVAREKQAGAEIVFTQDTHGESYAQTQEGRLLPVPHCIKGTAGWEIVPALKSFAETAKTFEKGTFGATALAEYVHSGAYGEITLCGVCTDICVISNALLIKAYCPEAAVRVVAAACAGTSVKNHNAALLAMKSCQVIVE